MIVTSYIFTSDGHIDYEKVKKMVDSVGKERLVLDLSCRKRDDGDFYVVIDRWQKFTDFKACSYTLISDYISILFILESRAYFCFMYSVCVLTCAFLAERR